jgi:hypothetical protein
MKTLTLTLAVLLFASALLAESKYILNAKRLSSTEEAISCSNGADPTGVKVGNTLVISCGR